ncbi:NAD(P)-binding protein [Dothidotthia symphoricarpi CBS 119687]|uniref:NAD(P)-binding protein n=1 Tax=Dothidotthia symphoricarpi CBS 119687 TaxID=1392245 RepID=A0A6A6A980_9PLEO|nr:NAD(P)-binding protein [Dothidotthia symphoricarpi CBS 119687]KAF2127397.1 NAD(P)-binding protein [Dothidotthia symphoricarpi CBS 119687]
MAESAEERFQRIIVADQAGRIDFDNPFPTDFTGKRVLITGGASGIGAATARMFASKGAHVVIADLDRQAGETLAAELQQHFVQVDVASWDSQVAMFAAALRVLPAQEIDILITSAGVGGSDSWNMVPCSPMELLQRAEHIQAPSTSCIDIGLTGCMNSIYLGTKYAMGLTSDQHGDKSVILLGSFAGYNGLANRPDYTATKWAVRGIFRCLRQTLLPLGARANLLAPTFVATPMTAHLVEKLTSQGVQMGDMEMVLEAISRMASDPQMNEQLLLPAKAF